ncbi:hypothetical protein N7497_005949 [Penicillium chrysogenum]|nr:hypothetical protein N7497_005949 [Penicillium chrysogenum]
MGCHHYSEWTQYSSYSWTSPQCPDVRSPGLENYTKRQNASQFRLLATGSAGLWMLVRTRGIADLRQGEKGEEGVEEEKEHLAHFLPPGGHDKRTSGSRKMFVLCVV